MPKVSILHRDGSTDDYSTYLAARTAAVSRDLIQIWASLNEQIVLKDLVDIWVAPGVTLDYSSGVTVTDNNVACICNIYGYGKLIKTSSSSYIVCSFSINSYISIKCEVIENNANSQPCISSLAKKFHLNCRSVYGLGYRGGAIYLSSANTEDINVEAEKIITGKENDTDTGVTAIDFRGYGFLKADEILCRNLGHTMRIVAGELTANIRKMTTVRETANIISTVHVAQGTGIQKLVLYFDEIRALRINPNLSSGNGVDIYQGSAFLFGRKIISTSAAAVETTNLPNPKGYIKCIEIIGEYSTPLVLQHGTNLITIDANLIEGNNPGPTAGVVWSSRAATFVLKNATIKNNNTSSLATGMKLFKDLDNIPDVTLRNIKIISNGPIIFYDTTSPPVINIKNYGLIGNKDTESNVNLQIGTSINYWFIDSPDLT